MIGIRYIKLSNIGVILLIAVFLTSCKGNISNNISESLEMTKMEKMTENSFESQTNEDKKGGDKMKKSDNIMSIMSFNIYWKLSEDYDRVKRVFKVIDEYSPDIFCVQEETSEWQTYMEEHFDEKYSHVGILRMVTEGEGCRIYYLTEKFTPVDSGTIWLTETPDVMSITEGADHYRICTYVILRNNLTQKKFIVTNIHTENGVTDKKLKARASQLNCFRQFLEKYEGMTRISVGDYNTEEGSQLYKKYMVDKDMVCDAKYVAKQTKIINHTYHGFDDNPKNYEMIDYCLVSPDVTVDRYEVIDMKVDGLYPSDHYPLIITVEG